MNELVTERIGEWMNAPWYTVDECIQQFDTLRFQSIFRIYRHEIWTPDFDVYARRDEGKSWK